MKCPKCQFQNEEEAKFCLECGEKLELECPQCGKTLTVLAKFCNQCGQILEEVIDTEKTALETEAERKYVTVLFSDLSGYTAMSEKIDPEEVKEITGRIFAEISKMINKYEGFVEKFIGDAVMALFGVPKAHEDDPVRAVKVAKEIHQLVDDLSPEVENRIGQSISMHTGINTGLVVTGEVDMEKGTHGVAGETVNLASRLSSLAKSGEVLVDRDTYRQVEGHFAFESLGPTTIKGKAEPVQVYKVLTPKERPVTIHRLSGLRADLIGRKAELAELREAVENLQQGKGRIFSICGGAGTGKSRLVEDFKATLNLEKFQWLEGHAYPYAQSIPYFPLIDLLNRVFQIEEGDPPKKIRKKIESEIEYLIGKKEDVVPYVGSLYELSYPEVEDVSPEFWKFRLQDSALTIISAFAKKAPTIFCLEDLHWADPSFVELLRNAVSQIRQPAIVLCVYRPVFTLFTSHQIEAIAKNYQEIRLKDLSASEAQDMLESLLNTDNIPFDLKRFVQDKVEGNPFYLEEMVNSFIESETLIQDNGNWKITKPISESDISTTIHGVISGRLDRLEDETKRILQEASVIGRAFFYEILKRVTELKQDIDRSLRGLEQFDLIRTRSLQPDLEYMFKHALTQEVVYNGLLKKKRKEIHERIGLVIEGLFQDRLPEFYETLAFHFKQGRSFVKAVNYLIRSGEKSMRRFALEDAHRYYKEALDLLVNKQNKTKEESRLVIDLLIKWGLVFYYRGDFKGLIDLLSAHEDLAESQDDKALLGLFTAWLGFAQYMDGRVKDSYLYLIRALELGEETGDQMVIGYACTWLSWTCSEIKLREAIGFGKRAHEIAKLIKSDHYMYFKSLGGIGYSSLCMGEQKRCFEIGNILLDYGKQHSNIRCLVVGHINMGYGHFAAGNYLSAIECFKRAIEVSADPFYAQWPRTFLGATYSILGHFQDAEKALQEVEHFCQNFGCGVLGIRANAFLGLAYIGQGNKSQGLKMIIDAQQTCLENERKWLYTLLELVLGKVYFQIVEGAGQTNFPGVVKNVGFLMRNVPLASKKAEDHFNGAIENARDMGAKNILGQTCLELGLLHKAKKRREQAKECISEAIQIFEECEAEVFLKRANEALESL